MVRRSKCPECGSNDTLKDDVLSTVRGITYRVCAKCGYVGKWMKFR